MPRVSKGPRYYPSKKAWFANFNKRRHLLVEGPKKSTEAFAKQEYERLRASLAIQVDGDRATCWVILNGYLNDLEVRPDPPAPNTLAVRKRYVDSFLSVCGNIRVNELSMLDANAWLKAMMDEGRRHPKTGRCLAWSKGTRKLATSVIKSAFKWALDNKICTKNPLSGFSVKSEKYQGKMLAVTAEEHRALLTHALNKTDMGFAQLLMFFHGTGSRPAEIHRATASEWNEDLKAFVIPPGIKSQGRYKLAGHGRPRKVYIPDHLVPLARLLMRKHPKGPIFRNQLGTPFNTVSLSQRFKIIRNSVNKKAGEEVVRPGITSYSYRHDFVTRWMTTPGADVKTLATLLDTSMAQIEKTYSHLFDHDDVVRAALMGFQATLPGGGSLRLQSESSE